MRSIDEAVNFARKEKWKQVDKRIPGLVKDPQSLIYATKSPLVSTNPNLRDLGATILQRAKNIPGHIRNEATSRLHYVMTHNSSSYDGFRAACALAVHHSNGYKSSIRKTLTNFTKDKEVGKMACAYMRFVR